MGNSGKPVLISITGKDGSPRNEVIEILKKKIQSMGLSCQEVTIWDIMYDEQTSSTFKYRSPNDFDDFLAVLDNMSRSMLIFMCMYQSLMASLKKTSDVYLINGIWTKYVASEIAFGSDKDTLLGMTGMFPEIDYTFMLNMPAEMAFDKKENVTAYETGFSRRTKENFLDQQEKLSKAFESLRTLVKWVDIDGTKSVEHMADEILNTVSVKIDRLKG